MSNKSKYIQLSLLLLVVVYAVVVIRNAWVGDDGYITLRTVDNFINGYGLTWNVGERVQAYTHPLWMFLMSAAYLFTREAFYTSIFVSVVVSVAAVVLVSFRVARSMYVAALTIVALILSKGFVDYSTSGLENPLTHLLLVSFFLIFLSREQADNRFILHLSLVASLLALTRMDNVLLVAPVFGYLLWQNRSWKAVGLMALGFVPLILWRLFSLFYYGFLWPNTAYAKLTTGVSWVELVGQGFYYVWSSFSVDPLTVIVIAAGILIPLIRKQWRLAMISAGAALYLIYVVRIGGCFMSGRLLTAPLVMAVIVLSQYPLKIGKTFGVAAVAVLVLGLGASRSPIYTTAEYGGENERSKFGRGIVDERGWYFAGAGLLNAPDEGPMPSHRYAELGRIQRRPLTARSTVGYYGYFVGTNTYVIDICGLGDPLLARLPFDTTQTWRIGHIYRAIPDGYVETILSTKNVIKDPALREYYDNLSLVVKGSLWDGERLATIIRMNLGGYDHLIEVYSGG